MQNFPPSSGTLHLSLRSRILASGGSCQSHPGASPEPPSLGKGLPPLRHSQALPANAHACRSHVFLGYEATFLFKIGKRAGWIPPAPSAHPACSGGQGLVRGVPQERRGSFLPHHQHLGRAELQRERPGIFIWMVTAKCMRTGH